MMVPPLKTGQQTGQAELYRQSRASARWPGADDASGMPRRAAAGGGYRAGASDLSGCTRVLHVGHHQPDPAAYPLQLQPLPASVPALRGGWRAAAAGRIRVATWRLGCRSADREDLLIEDLRSQIC